MDEAKAELKAKLLRQYEALLDEVLSRDETEGGQTLAAIEEKALHIRSEIGREVTTGLVELDSGQQVPGPGCEGCGREMAYKGRKHRWVQTRSGAVEVERAYYYCRECRRGIFPPG